MNKKNNQLEYMLYDIDCMLTDSYLSDDGFRLKFSDKDFARAYKIFCVALLQKVNETKQNKDIIKNNHIEINQKLQSLIKMLYI